MYIYTIKISGQIFESQNYIFMDKISNRIFKIFAGTSLILATISLTGCRSCGGDDSPAEKGAMAEKPGAYLLIGSYAGPEDPGIHVYSYDADNLQMNEVQQVTGNSNPSFLAVHPSGNFLYSVNEISGFNETEEGSVTSFIIERETGKLRFLNRRSSKGAHPCHISVLPDGSHVLVANYSGGNLAALPVAADGSLEEATETVQHHGSGPDNRRQRGPHAHSVYPSSDGTRIYAADLGIDKVMVYKSQGGDGLFAADPVSPYAGMEPGAGPRHIAFHPGGEWIYVVNELKSTVTRVIPDDQTGRVSVAESVTTLPSGWEGDNFCADIHVHPSGNFLYASNRGHNSIAIFRLESDGKAVPAGHEPVRGEWPRNFAIDPQGKRLLVANQRSGNITVFDIDMESGRLIYTGQEINVDQPVCLLFIAG